MHIDAAYNNIILVFVIWSHSSQHHFHALSYIFQMLDTSCCCFVPIILQARATDLVNITRGCQGKSLQIVILASLMPLLFLCSALSRQEIVIGGLLGITTAPCFSVEDIEGKGRGLVVREEVTAGSYVLEYEAEVYPRKERRSHKREYIGNNEGCFIIDVQTADGWVCLDATRCLVSPGRLLNHAPRDRATLAPFKPLFLKGRWRVGFVATRDLHPGQELTWDYGCSPGGRVVEKAL